MKRLVLAILLVGIPAVAAYGYIEIYQRAAVRRPIDYWPYFRELSKS